MEGKNQKNEVTVKEVKSKSSVLISLSVGVIVVVGVYMYSQKNTGGMTANITSPEVTQEQSNTQAPQQDQGTQQPGVVETNTETSQVPQAETQPTQTPEAQVQPTTQTPGDQAQPTGTTNTQAGQPTTAPTGKSMESTVKSTAQVQTIGEKDNVKGSETGQIVIIEYSNFQCPSCYAMFRMIEESWFMIGSKVRFSVRYIDLPEFTNAKLAAQYAEAAGKQGKYWEMYDEIFMKQNTWTTSQTPGDVFEGMAKSLGLDIAKLKKDANSKEVLEKIENDYKSAKDLGINQAPVIFVNGNKIENPPHKYGFMNMVTFKEREISGLDQDGNPINGTGSKTGTGN